MGFTSCSKAAIHARNSVINSAYEPKWSTPQFLQHEATKSISTCTFRLDWMLVNCRVTPRIKFTGTHLYTSWVKRDTGRVQCLSNEHSTMCPARTLTWTTQSGNESTNHEATATPQRGSKEELLITMPISLSTAAKEFFSLSLAKSQIKVARKKSLFLNNLQVICSSAQPYLILS